MQKIDICWYILCLGTGHSFNIFEIGSNSYRSGQDIAKNLLTVFHFYR